LVAQCDPASTPRLVDAYLARLEPDGSFVEVDLFEVLGTAVSV
jgi:hypothetical protein